MSVMEETQNVNQEALKNAEIFQNLSDTEGKFFSPIDLTMDIVKPLKLPKLRWKNFSLSPTKMKLTNSGHTVLLSGKWHQTRPHLAGGPLLTNYVFSQIHFHWGKNEKEGSEHTTNGISYPLEMHVVFFKSVYLTQEAALKQSDGVVVLVYLFKIIDTLNPFIEALMIALTHVTESRTSSNIQPIPLSYLLADFTDDYFMYWGGILTHSCTHTVLWIVSRLALGIHNMQLDAFRHLQDPSNETITRNFRSPSPLESRSVFHVNPSLDLSQVLLPRIYQNDKYTPSVIVNCNYSNVYNFCKRNPKRDKLKGEHPNVNIKDELHNEKLILMGTTDLEETVQRNILKILTQLESQNKVLQDYECVEGNLDSSGLEQMGENKKSKKIKTSFGVQKKSIHETNVMKLKEAIRNFNSKIKLNEKDQNNNNTMSEACEQKLESMVINGKTKDFEVNDSNLVKVQDKLVKKERNELITLYSNCRVSHWGSYRPSRCKKVCQSIYKTRSKRIELVKNRKLFEKKRRIIQMEEKRQRLFNFYKVFYKNRKIKTKNTFVGNTTTDLSISPRNLLENNTGYNLRIRNKVENNVQKTKRILTSTGTQCNGVLMSNSVNKNIDEKQIVPVFKEASYQSQVKSGSVLERKGNITNLSLNAPNLKRKYDSSETLNMKTLKVLIDNVNIYCEDNSNFNEMKHTTNLLNKYIDNNQIESVKRMNKNCEEKNNFSRMLDSMIKVNVEKDIPVIINKTSNEKSCTTSTKPSSSFKTDCTTKKRSSSSESVKPKISSAYKCERRSNSLLKLNTFKMVTNVKENEDNIGKIKNKHEKSVNSTVKEKRLLVSLKNNKGLFHRNVTDPLIQNRNNERVTLVETKCKERINCDQTNYCDKVISNATANDKLQKNVERIYKRPTHKERPNVKKNIVLNPAQGYHENESDYNRSSSPVICSCNKKKALLNIKQKSYKEDTMLSNYPTKQKNVKELCADDNDRRSFPVNCNFTKEKKTCRENDEVFNSPTRHKQICASNNDSKLGSSMKCNFAKMKMPDKEEKTHREENAFNFPIKYSENKYKDLCENDNSSFPVKYTTKKNTSNLPIKSNKNVAKEFCESDDDNRYNSASSCILRKKKGVSKQERQRYTEDYSNDESGSDFQIKSNIDRDKESDESDSSDRASSTKIHKLTKKKVSKNKKKHKESSGHNKDTSDSLMKHDKNCTEELFESVNSNRHISTKKKIKPVNKKKRHKENSVLDEDTYNSLIRKCDASDSSSSSLDQYIPHKPVKNRGLINEKKNYEKNKSSVQYNCLPQKSLNISTNENITNNNRTNDEGSVFISNTSEKFNKPTDIYNEELKTDITETIAGSSIQYSSTNKKGFEDINTERELYDTSQNKILEEENGMSYLATDNDNKTIENNHRESDKSAINKKVVDTEIMTGNDSVKANIDTQPLVNNSMNEFLKQAPNIETSILSNPAVLNQQITEHPMFQLFNLFIENIIKTNNSNIKNNQSPNNENLFKTFNIENMVDLKPSNDTEASNYENIICKKLDDFNNIEESVKGNKLELEEIYIGRKLQKISNSPHLLAEKQENVDKYFDTKQTMNMKLMDKTLHCNDSTNHLDSKLLENKTFSEDLSNNLKQINITEKRNVQNDVITYNHNTDQVVTKHRLKPVLEQANNSSLSEKDKHNLAKPISVPIGKNKPVQISSELIKDSTDTSNGKNIEIKCLNNSKVNKLRLQNHPFKTPSNLNNREPKAFNKNQNERNFKLSHQKVRCKSSSPEPKAFNKNQNEHNFKLSHQKERCKSSSPEPKAFNKNQNEHNFKLSHQKVRCKSSSTEPKALNKNQNEHNFKLFHQNVRCKSSSPEPKAFNKNQNEHNFKLFHQNIRCKSSSPRRNCFNNYTMRREGSDVSHNGNQRKVNNYRTGDTSINANSNDFNKTIKTAGEKISVQVEKNNTPQKHNEHDKEEMCFTESVIKDSKFCNEGVLTDKSYNIPVKQNNISNRSYIPKPVLVKRANETNHNKHSLAKNIINPADTSTSKSGNSYITKCETATSLDTMLLQEGSNGSEQVIQSSSDYLTSESAQNGEVIKAVKTSVCRTYDSSKNSEVPSTTLKSNKRITPESNKMLQYEIFLNSLEVGRNNDKNFSTKLENETIHERENLKTRMNLILNNVEGKITHNIKSVNNLRKVKSVDSLHESKLSPSAQKYIRNNSKLVINTSVIRKNNSVLTKTTLPISKHQEDEISNNKTSKFPYLKRKSKSFKSDNSFIQKIKNLEKLREKTCDTAPSINPEGKVPAEKTNNKNVNILKNKSKLPTNSDNQDRSKSEKARNTPTRELNDCNYSPPIEIITYTPHTQTRRTLLNKNVKNLPQNKQVADSTKNNQLTKPTYKSHLSVRNEPMRKLPNTNYVSKQKVQECNRTSPNRQTQLQSRIPKFNQDDSKRNMKNVNKT